MSAIKIVTPLDSTDVCAACAQIQLAWFRNAIKETWNKINNDRKAGVVEIIFNPNPDMLWEPPITVMNGSQVCLTHLFNAINQNAEAAAQIDAARKNGPGLQVAHSIEGLRADKN